MYELLVSSSGLVFIEFSDRDNWFKK